jgi:hypothetical protein
LGKGYNQILRQSTLSVCFELVNSFLHATQQGSHIRSPALFGIVNYSLKFPQKMSITESMRAVVILKIRTPTVMYRYSTERAEHTVVVSAVFAALRVNRIVRRFTVARCVQPLIFSVHTH